MTGHIGRMMRAAVTHDWNDIRVEQVPVPELQTGEVLVRVGACSICGTDLKMLAGVYRGLWPPTLPFIQGHEWGGTVVALGDGAVGLKVGDRVVAENHKGCGRCTNCKRGLYNLCESSTTGNSAHKIYGHTAPGAFAEYAARPVELLHKLPDTISFEEACLVNQGALGLHAVRRCGIEAGDTVAVIGPGLIGLVTIQLAKASGAARVIAVGSGPRLELAETLGADEVVDFASSDPLAAIQKLTNRRGVDCAFECAGSPDAVRTALGCTRRGGRVGLIGLTGNGAVEFDTDRLALDEIAVYGVRSSPNTYPELIELIAAGKVDVEKLISRVYPLERIAEAIEAFRRRDGGAIRIVIKM